jgi:hypothetical protein
MTISRVRILIAGVAVSGVAVAVIGHPPPARADDLSFLTDIKAAGFGSDDGNGALIAAGRHMCGTLSSGVAPDQVAREFFEESQIGSLGMARRFVAIAQQDLCTGPGAS